MAEIHLSKYDFWQYRDDGANCWDFVAQWLSEFKGVPVVDVPKFEINPKDKRSMHRASLGVARNFIECGPVDGAIAAHYHGNTIQHVGVVDNGFVRHVGEKIKVRRDKIKTFERMAATTKYYLHKSLANGIN